MSNRSPKTIRVDDDLWTEFENRVYEEEGNSNGAKPKHLENAIREYLDKGRDARIEEKLDEIHTHLLGESNTHTHIHAGSGNKGSDTVERVRQIAERLYTNHASSGNEVIHNNDVERAIEDIAGVDDRTIAKYKKQLKRRQLLYNHPGGPIWTDQKDQWVPWVEDYLNAKPTADLHDVTDEYDMTTEEYEDYAEKVAAQ